jgi:oligoribonuclease
MSKLFWIDLEMSGLEVESNVIIEAAAVITDFELNELESYHAVVKQDQKYIDQMDDWNKKTHGESGLIQMIPHGKNPDLVEEELINLVRKHFGNEKVIIAGNSVNHDKLFLNTYFKKLSQHFHYRTLDVTSWKIVMKNTFQIDFQKKNAHRAIDDIRESILELKHYLKYFKKP